VRAIDSNRGLLSLDTGRSTCFDDHSPAPWITRVTALRGCPRVVEARVLGHAVLDAAE